MKLRIVREGEDNLSTPEEFKIVGSQLQFNAVHLFIASNRWETITIAVTDSIPRGVLRYVIKQTDKVYVSVDEFTEHTLKLLCEIYPEMQGRLTKAFLKGEDINGLLPKMW